MKKSKTVEFRVTEEEYERIKEEASEQGEKISSYARLCVQKNLGVKWIKKSEVQQALSRIANVLDKYNDRNNRMAEAVRKEVVKLWDKI